VHEQQRSSALREELATVRLSWDRAAEDLRAASKEYAALREENAAAAADFAEQLGGATNSAERWRDLYLHAEASCTGWRERHDAVKEELRVEKQRSLGDVVEQLREALRLAQADNEAAVAKLERLQDLDEKLEVANLDVTALTAENARWQAYNAEMQRRTVQAEAAAGYRIDQAERWRVAAEEAETKLRASIVEVDRLVAENSRCQQSLIAHTRRAEEAERALGARCAEARALEHQSRTLASNLDCRTAEAEKWQREWQHEIDRSGQRLCSVCGLGTGVVNAEADWVVCGACEDTPAAEARGCTHEEQ
jgi:hypothetical protein